MELEMNHNYKLSHLWGVSSRLKPQVDMGAAAELKGDKRTKHGFDTPARRASEARADGGRLQHAMKPLSVALGTLYCRS